MTHSWTTSGSKKKLLWNQKKYLETKENGNTTHQNLLYAAEAFKKEVHSNKCIHQAKERSQINNQLYTSKN